MTCLSTHFFYFVLCNYSIGIWEGDKAVYRGKACRNSYDSLKMVDTANISARGGRIFPPQLGPLVPIVTEYRCFLGILRSSRLSVHMVALKIVCWYRDWIGITRSWLVCNVWTKWAGTTRRQTFTCGIAPVRLIRTNL